MPSASPISATFASLRAQNQMAFMPFVTAGDPDLNATCELIRELDARGVDLIEIGFPYSDPIADGPVIQASYTRALQQGLHVNDIFAAIKSVTTDASPPRCAMVAYSIIFRFGIETFLAKAKDAGFAGLIVPDLPGDEAGEFFAAVRTAELDLIQLVAPTTPPARVNRILEHCSGFVYCISVAGTTGVRKALPETLQHNLRTLREKTDLPLAVGFGISSPDHVPPLRGLADGVIVGSAIVRQLEDVTAETAASAIRGIGDYATNMLTAVR